MTLTEKSESAEYLQSKYGVSERHVCRLLRVHRTTKRAYSSKDYRCEQTQRVIELSHIEPRWGYRKIYDRLRLDGVSIGRETVRLIRKREGLQVRRKQRKRRFQGQSGTLTKATHPHQVWCYDFVFDTTTESRRLKCLTVVDECSRFGLEIACSRSITANGVIATLKLLIARWGKPEAIRSDNGLPAESTIFAQKSFITLQWSVIS